MTALFWLIDNALSLYQFFLFLWFVLNLLNMFGVLPHHNRVLASIMDFLDQIIEPALRPIRRIIPLIGNVDLSPLVLYFAINFVRIFLARDLAPLLGV